MEKIAYLCIQIKNNTMKNVNLTGLYLALVASCDVTGFELSGLRKIDSVEPTDALITFYPKDVNKVDISDVNKILKENITGEVMSMQAIIDNQNNISIYIEFDNSDFNDEYAYTKD